MGRELHPTPLNDNFFNKDSAKVWYILGLLVDTYLPLRGSEKDIIFRNRDYNLVKIIKTNLECENNITSDNRDKNSHFFQVTNRRLRLSLEERGLTPDKRNRKFPDNIPEEFVHHYIRGFIEDKCVKRDYIEKIILPFYHDYLAGLNKSLREHCDVEKQSITGSETYYGFQDTGMIHEFIYKKHKNLYLPNVKDKFRLINPHEAKRKNIDEKIKKAKRLLLQGKKGDEIASILGCASRTSFYISFRKNTGMNTRTFIRGNYK